MSLLRVRVTSEDSDFLTEVAMWCDKLLGSKVFVCAEEISTKGKKHFHLVTQYEKSLSTFNRLFTKQYPQLVGNKSKSISEATESLEINLRYVCKGQPQKEPNILLSNITHEEIMKLHTDYWANNLDECRKQTSNRIAAGLEEIKKEAKAKKKTWMEKITDEFIIQYSREHMIELQDHVTHFVTIGGEQKELSIRKFRYVKNDMKIIQKFVLKKLGNSSKILDEFIVKRMSLGLLNAVTHGEDEELEAVMFCRAFPDL